MKITIPLTPPSELFPNRARRTSFHEKSDLSKAIRRDTSLLAGGPGDGPAFFPFKGLNVEVVVAWERGRRMPDVEAISLAVKPMIDGLTDAGIWGDDRQIQRICYEQMRDQNGDGFVEFTITERAR